MKKISKKIKAIITALWVVILSFFSKVMGEIIEQTAGVAPYDGGIIKTSHWISSPWWIVIKIAQRVLIWVTLITWIVSLIKIKKTDDKAQKKKRTKRTIIIMSILVVILIAAFLIPTLLLKK